MSDLSDMCDILVGDLQKDCMLCLYSQCDICQFIWCSCIFIMTATAL